MSKIKTSNENHKHRHSFMASTICKKPLLAMLKGVSIIFANDLVPLTIRVAAIS